MILLQAVADQFSENSYIAAIIALFAALGTVASYTKLSYEKRIEEAHKAAEREAETREQWMKMFAEQLQIMNNIFENTNQIGTEGQIRHEQVMEQLRALRMILEKHVAYKEGIAKSKSDE